MATIKGGEKLELALAKIAAQLAKPGTLRVGFLEGSTAPNGDSMPLRAAIHNYGAPRAGVPARPFFSLMVAEKQKEWPMAIASLLKPNDYDVERVLVLTGQGIAKQLKESILKFSGVPLKPATIKRKGFDKQLIEHGDMLRAVDFEVTTK